MSYDANRTAHRLLCNCLHRGDSRHRLYATLTVSAAATRYRRAAHHQLTRPVGPIGLVGPGSPDPVASTARLERGLCAQRASLAVHPRPQPRLAAPRESCALMCTTAYYGGQGTCRGTCTAEYILCRFIWVLNPGDYSAFPPLHFAWTSL